MGLDAIIWLLQNGPSVFPLIPGIQCLGQHLASNPSEVEIHCEAMSHASDNSWTGHNKSHRVYSLLAQTVFFPDADKRERTFELGDQPAHLTSAHPTSLVAPFFWILNFCPDPGKTQPPVFPEWSGQMGFSGTRGILLRQ